ncbi:N-6 DNA methylase [uncultured Sphingobium sp.]|uniref:Eco57I restriction-modification methylase domain-containing protein n=1 Tax=uncultured Sphingobium sp. TaxID=316087 RepID=UPI00259B6F5D|nr:N-6 DNA methylase [uncultured Sphingobium sp.]
MSRHTKRSSDTGFAALTIEGGLIAPDQVQAIASAAPDQKTAADYGCPKGTGLRDEITRYFRIAQAHWQGYARLEQPTMQQTAEFARNLLEQAFGFELTGPHHHMREDRRFTIAWEAKGGRVPIVIAPPAPADKGKAGDGFARALPEFGDGADGRIARRSPTVLLQDWLNANPDFYWGLVFAGDRVRLMRDNASLTRPAWIEADLGAIFRDEMFADFAALWLLIHASRFGAEGAAASDCALERWREAGMRAGTSARERLRVNVEEALMALGQGILDANPAIRERLDTNQLTMQHLFEQMLRVVYRLIFLGVAEDRDLLHPPATTKAVRDLYSNNYGFAWARDKSTRRNAHDHHHDAWEGVKVTFRALERGEKLLGLPALGGLFDRALTPDLDAAQIPNRSLLAAAFKLGWLIEDGRRVRINWRDMATEELGSVYEGLLELVPVREDEGRTFSFAGGAEARGNARKVSGSYYTPDSLVQCLLDSALDPVLERAEAEGGADAILELNVIDPACGSGHFLLGASRRMATRVAQLRNPDAPDYNAAMRDVVRNCIHGVDRNPMAIELAKVALWIESVEPGKPLGFLDANIQCGDSLLGVFDLKALDEGIPDDAYKPLTGDDKDTAKYFTKRNKDEKKGQGTLDFIGGGGTLPPAKLAATMDDLRHLPEDSMAQIAEKRRRFAAWEADPKRYATKVACDLYIAAFLLPKKGGVPANANSVTVPTTSHLRTRLDGGQIYGPLEAAAVDAAGYARAFHWPLAFPEVMIGKSGFDVVLGNPPWERIKVQEHEYFASLDPNIAGEKSAKIRTAMINELKLAPSGSNEIQLYLGFEGARRTAEAASSFMLMSKEQFGRFPFCGRGDVNTYALFAELFHCLARKGGQAGVIVPTGIATDALTAQFFGHLVSSQRLAELIDFENREKLFPAVDSRMKFALLTLGDDVAEAGFAFFLTDPAQLEQAERRFTLSPVQIARINPNTKTTPVFRARRDAELTAAIYERVPGLIDESKGDSGNPWELSHASTFFDMTRDARYFHKTADFEAGEEEKSENIAISIRSTAKYLPLFEAKMLHIFDHRWSSALASDDESGLEILKSDPNVEAVPRFWVASAEIQHRLARHSWSREWLIGVRKITNATNERTIIPTFFPLGAVGNSEHLLFSGSRFSSSIVVGLVCSLSSLTLDYVARQKLGGTNLNYFYLEQLPILPPTAYSESDLAFIVPRVLELTYTSHSMTPFARDLGYDGPPFAWDEDRRAQLRAELDAWYALAYGLTRDELRYVLDPKDVMGADYPSETFRVLQKNEIAKHGEYRTQRLVLAAYDALSASAPETAALADGQWRGTISEEADVRLLLAAILKRMRQPRSSREVRAAFLFAAQPHLLMAHVNTTAQAEWQRLVGDAASLPVSQSVPTLSARQLAHFGTAQAMLAARNAWRYDAGADLVDRGAAIYDMVLPPWVEGRADFVWHALRSIDLSSPAVTAAFSQGEQSFVAQSAAA